jgi:hypothetical protein
VLDEKAKHFLHLGALPRLPLPQGSETRCLFCSSQSPAQITPPLDFKIIARCRAPLVRWRCGKLLAVDGGVMRGRSLLQARMLGGQKYFSGMEGREDLQHGSAGKPNVTGQT